MMEILISYLSCTFKVGFIYDDVVPTFLNDKHIIYPNEKCSIIESIPVGSIVKIIIN